MKLTSRQDCDSCRHAPNRWTDEPCRGCDEANSRHERRTDPGDMDCASRRAERGEENHEAD